MTDMVAIDFLIEEMNFRLKNNNYLSSMFIASNIVEILQDQFSEEEKDVANIMNKIKVHTCDVKVGIIFVIHESNVNSPVKIHRNIDNVIDEIVINPYTYCEHIKNTINSDDIIKKLEKEIFDLI